MEPKGWTTSFGKRGWILLLTAWATAARGGVSAAETVPLSLEGYLGQVTTEGPAYQSAQKAAAGLEKQKCQTDLLYSPQLVAHAANVNDRSEQISPQFYGDKTTASDYGVGVVKKWKYGPSTSFNYGWTRTRIEGSSLISDDPSFQTVPSVSISVPLWRDFLGSQTRSQMDKNRMLIESAQYNAMHQREGALFQARNAYWRLQLARKEVEIRRDAFERAKTLVSWSERRVSLNLVDDSESLQARAGRQVRELELQQALERERAARVAFNRLRGVRQEEVPEILDDLESQAVSCVFQWPEKAPRRWDLRAMESKAASDKAAWKDAKGYARPDLSAFASVASNGLDPHFGGAHAESVDARRPATKIGAQITVPLDVFKAKKAADGYELNYQASLEADRDKRLQADQEWAQLRERLEDVNQRSAMVEKIEAVQKSKVEKERERLRLGRSTQFQLQSYEVEYLMSRLQRQAVLYEKLALWAEGEWMMAADKEDAGREANAANQEGAK